MTQAATLTQQQLQRVLDYTRTRRHYKRNRAIILLTHYAMLRVGEVAALRYCDVVDADGEIKAETTLSAAQTKGISVLTHGSTLTCCLCGSIQTQAAYTAIVLYAAQRWVYS